MELLKRPALEGKIEESLKHFPITLLLGPRQCGKTTIARLINKRKKGTFFDLEDPRCPLKPEIAATVLEDLQGLVVIDEFQNQPGLFSLLRVLVDKKPRRVRYLILGSSSPELVKGVSQTLAGRVSFVEMGGFSLAEVGIGNLKKLWLRGGFPDSFLSKTHKNSDSWRLNFIRSFLERDIPKLGIRIPSTTIRRFWMMVAHLHGQLWNAATLARSLGTKEDTARRYLDILCGTFMLRQLPPWHENIKKRLIKSPKVYLRDSGLLHTLLDLRIERQLYSHPILGFSWEGFAIERLIELLDASDDAFFYRTHGGAELDLLLTRGGKKYGFECKFSDSPGKTRSMTEVIRDLKLEKLWIIYPGRHRYPIDKKIEILPLSECPKTFKWGIESKVKKK
ncbi:ATP-binding protein [Candidatus Riflebacteria bacterium]